MIPLQQQRIPLPINNFSHHEMNVSQGNSNVVNERQSDSTNQKHLILNEPQIQQPIIDGERAFALRLKLFFLIKFTILGLFFTIKFLN